jgi:hypothetical protein
VLASGFVTGSPLTDAPLLAPLTGADVVRWGRSVPLLEPLPTPFVGTLRRSTGAVLAGTGSRSTGSRSSVPGSGSARRVTPSENMRSTFGRPRRRIRRGLAPRAETLALTRARKGRAQPAGPGAESPQRFAPAAVSSSSSPAGCTQATSTPAWLQDHSNAGSQGALERRLCPAVDRIGHNQGMCTSRVSGALRSQVMLSPSSCCPRVGPTSQRVPSDIDLLRTSGRQTQNLRAFGRNLETGISCP